MNGAPSVSVVTSGEFPIFGYSPSASVNSSPPWLSPRTTPSAAARVAAPVVSARHLAVGCGWIRQKRARHRRTGWRSCGTSGCTGHAHEVATGLRRRDRDRAQTLVHDAANPAEVMHDVVKFATAGHTPEESERIVQMIQQTAREWAVHNFSSGCEVADMLVERARLRRRVAPVFVVRCAAPSNDGTGTDILPTPAAKRSLREAGPFTSARTWRRLTASSRRTRRWTQPGNVAAARTTRPWPICSWSTDCAWLNSSTSGTLGRGPRLSSPSRGACWTAPISITR